MVATLRCRQKAGGVTTQYKRNTDSGPLNRAQLVATGRRTYNNTRLYGSINITGTHNAKQGYHILHNHASQATLLNRQHKTPDMALVTRCVINTSLKADVNTSTQQAVDSQT